MTSFTFVSMPFNDRARQFIGAGFLVITRQPL